MRPTRPLVPVAEVALLAVTLAAVVGMHRLFSGGSWLGPLVAHAVAAHAVAAAARRRGWSLPLAAGAAAGVALLATAWISYRATTTVGVPSAATLDAARADLSDALAAYREVVAPTPVLTGYVVASGLAVWCIAFVADWAAFRLWVPFEATLPAGTLFLFTALLGADPGRAGAAGLFGAAVLGFLLLHRVARQEVASHWVGDRRAAGRRSMLVAGGTLSVLAVLGGVVLGPNLPGADAPGVLDPSELNDRDQPRVTISPLVDIRSRLVDQSNLEVFTVRADRRAYWRLTALERFDGEKWTSSGSFGKADGDLDRAVDVEVAVEPLAQEYRISALSAIWLPAAYQAAAYEGTGEVEARFDDESATLIVDDEVPTSDGLGYSVVSEVPVLDAAALARSEAVAPADLAERYLALPADLSPRVVQLAQELVAGRTSPYERAKALQDHLRTFTYDLDVAAGHSDDVLEQFLFDTRRGYCEQFAGAFAAMARVVGLPARVAVGFTPGEVDPADPQLFHVRGEHAHAWPEVYLDGAGWVAFEPTPGRGIPGAEPYTGVPEAQAQTGAPDQSVTAPAPAPAPDGSTGTSTPPTTAPAGGGGEQGGEDGTGDDGAATPPPLERFVTDPARRAVPWALVAALGYLALVPGLLLVRQALRRRRATDVPARIALAWTEAGEAAELVGVRAGAGDTYATRARRVADALPPAGPPALDLARLAEEAHYGPAALGADAAEAAWAHRGEVHAAAWRAAPWAARARRWLDPRGPWRAWREERTVRRATVQLRPAAGSGSRTLVGVGVPTAGTGSDAGGPIVQLDDDLRD